MARECDLKGADLLLAKILLDGLPPALEGLISLLESTRLSRRDHIVVERAVSVLNELKQILNRCPLGGSDEGFQWTKRLARWRLFMFGPE